MMSVVIALFNLRLKSSEEALQMLEAFSDGILLDERAFTVNFESLRNYNDQCMTYCLFMRLT